VVKICVVIVFLILSIILGHAAAELVDLSLCMKLVALTTAWIMDSFLDLEKLSTAHLHSSSLGALSYIFARPSTMRWRSAPDDCGWMESSRDSPQIIMLRISCE
jgi:hypothetical protein